MDKWSSPRLEVSCWLLPDSRLSPLWEASGSPATGSPGQERTWPLPGTSSLSRTQIARQMLSAPAKSSLPPAPSLSEATDYRSEDGMGGCDMSLEPDPALELDVTLELGHSW